MDPDDQVEEAMDVDDAAPVEGEGDVAEDVEMDGRRAAIAERLERRRKKFRDKMTRFDEFSAITGLRVDHIEWPMIKGRHLQREPLTGPSFVHGNQIDEQYNLQTWPRETLLHITATQLFTAGVGLINNPDVTLFVFQRTMRCLSAYCGFMWHDAVAHRRKQINKYSLHRLIAMSDFRLFMFYRKFLPNPDPNQETFSNHYTALLNHYYFNDPRCQALYHDAAHHDPINIRGDRLTLQHRMYLPAYHQHEQFDPVYFTNFINPTGFSLSRFHAYRLHEALGSPPMESEIIIVLDWMAKLVINEISYKTLVYQDSRGLAGCPNLHTFQLAMEHEGDPLFNLDIDFTAYYPPAVPRVRVPITDYPKFYPQQRHKFSRLVDRYYRKVRMERALQDVRETFIAKKFPTKMMCGCVYSCRNERRRW